MRLELIIEVGECDNWTLVSDLALVGCSLEGRCFAVACFREGYSCNPTSRL